MIAKRRSIDTARDVAGFLGFVLRRWSEDRCPQMAAGLTYTTLIALVPLFAIVLAVLSAFGPVMAEIKAFLIANLTPQASSHVIGGYLEDFASKAQRLTFAGIAGVFFVSIMLMLMVDRSLNAIWRVRRARPYWLLVPVYAVLLIAGPMLAAVATTLANNALAHSRGAIPVPEDWVLALLRASPLAVSAAAFFLLYKLVPHRFVPWRHAALGAVVAAVLFAVLKEGFGAYVRLVPTYGIVYGTFATLPLFLVWLYFSWLIVLFGAELAACAAYGHRGLWRRLGTAGTHFHEAVLVARRLIAARGAPVAFKRLHAITRLPVGELEDLLARMEEAGIVRRPNRRQLALAAHPEAITLGDLYAATVAPVGGLRPEEWAEISVDLARAAADMRQALERPLASLSRKLDAVPRKTKTTR